MKGIALIAVLAFWAAQAFAEEGNYLLGPIEDAPIEIDVPEVSQDDRPVGVPDNAIRYLFWLRNVGGDALTYGPFPPRLFGIQAPERRQPFYSEATRALRFMLATGTDANNRGAAYVVDMGLGRDGSKSGQLYHSNEGYDINASLVCAGYAWWDRERAPDSKILSDCEAEARAKKLGIWSEENPIPPWEWRRGVRE